MYVPEPKRLKSGSYFIQLRLNGVSVPVLATTPKECKAEARMIKAEYLAGKRIIEAQKADPTLKAAMTAYIDARRNVLSPSTICGYVRIRDNRFGEVIDKQLSKIKDWQSVIDTEAKAHAPKTVRNEWRFVCSVLRANGILPPTVNLPQLIKAEHAYLEPEQIPAFVAAAKDDRACIQALLGLHSLRRSEIAALKWEDIDLKAGQIHVRGAAVFDEKNNLVQKQTTKNYASARTVPIMIPELKAALEAVPEEKRSGRVVTVAPDVIRRQVNRICEQNGLPKIGAHGLRHSFASLAFSADVGMTEREVMELGGWSDPQTVHKIYEHLAQRNRLKATNKMAQFYQNANKNANENQ